VVSGPSRSNNESEVAINDLVKLLRLCLLCVSNDESHYSRRTQQGMGTRLAAAESTPVMIGGESMELTFYMNEIIWHQILAHRFQFVFGIQLASISLWLAG